MKIEEGKYYRTRDGSKVKVIRKDIADEVMPFLVQHTGSLERWHYADGTATSENRDLVADWEEEPMNTPKDTPKKWKDMTPEEKGSLLLAYHEGKTIEVCDNLSGWDVTRFTLFAEGNAYRVKPKEPKRETVDLYGADFGKGETRRWNFSETGHIGPDTHKITFDTIDGKPDCSSIKMEAL